jgi:hypothetical protein
VKIDVNLEEAEGGERGEDGDFGCVLTEELDRADAVFVEGVVDVAGEVIVDGGGG